MITVLHYTGYTAERGGIVSVIRALHGEKLFRVVHGVSAGEVPSDPAGPERWRGPAIAGEKISHGNLWRARAVALAVRGWLQAEPGRVFHGHSRAGLLVGLWLLWFGERRVVVSVHCYGRRRWFYRWAAHRLGPQLFWLTPEMRRYYGVVGTGWPQCVPGGVPEDFFAITPAAPMPGRLRLGGAGMLVRWKRWDLVAEALALLPGDIRAQITFEHIGAATDEPDSQACAAQLRSAAARLGVAENMTWRGQENSSHRLLSAVDLLVVPSHREPYSMIIQEALAAGVPVLAAASGGPLDVILPGKNGWLFRDGDARALADELARQVRERAWTALDRAEIRRSARPARAAAVAWAEIYGRLQGQ